MDVERSSEDDETGSDIFTSDEDTSDVDYDSDSSNCYNPEGISSDDDVDGCCHWSTTKSNNLDDDLNMINQNIPQYGHVTIPFDAGTKPHDVIEHIMDDEFILKCIDATNEHGKNDQKFCENVGKIPSNEKGIWFVRGFFAIKWHLKLLKLPQVKWAWSDDPLKAQEEVKKTMTLDIFRLMLKHFRVMKPSELPAQDSELYHPLQNINAGADYLRDKAKTYWSVGKKLCIDEGRIRSKSKRNPYKTRNPDKPVRMGWTVCKISDKGCFGGNFVCNHVVKVGKKTYKNPQKGKNYDIVDQLLSGLKDNGRLIIMDSGFPTVNLLKDARQLWETHIIATQRGNTKHLPKSHKKNLSQAKQFMRGYSKTLHHQFLTLTYWNDNNAVTFLDNGIASGKEFWETINVNKGPDRSIIHVPLVAQLYREIYGWVDRSNQQMSYYSSELRSIRKQSRVFDNLCEMYVLVNGHTLWRNSNHLTQGMSKDGISQSEFRFAVIRVWYAMFRKTNGRTEVLHYPANMQAKHRKRLASTLMSPRKGSHAAGKILRSETTSRDQRLRCRICKRKSSFKCMKCSSDGHPLVLCPANSQRQCWNDYHIQREFDLHSSQSQEADD